MTVTWPKDLNPDTAPVHTVNILEMRATPEQVWQPLIRATEWSKWYGNCKKLRFDNHEGPDLQMGTRFNWVTFHVRVHTEVTEFEPHRLLAWRGHAPGGEGYHSWLIEPTPAGCRVITEEVQQGLLPKLGKWYLKPGLLKQHQRWLEGLEQRALEG